MKIHVDLGKCQGHAMCSAAAPALFPLDEEGYPDVGSGVVPEGEEELARRGAAACPERAITLED